MSNSSQVDRADALIAKIEAETRVEANRIEAGARAEARAILRAAHTKARRHVHVELGKLRRARADAEHKEKARLETSRRQRRHREASAAIEAALPVLEQELQALWDAPETRMSWVRSVVRAGSERLLPGQWTVVHPPGWDAAERGAVAEDIERRTGLAPEFIEDPALQAGLRLQAGATSLDASLAALIGDPAETGAAVLAVLETERGAKQ